MKKFLFAVSFLTKIPFSKLKFTPKEMGESSMYFSLVGFLIGAILILSNFILNKFLPNNIVNLAIVLISVFITGGIHIDGLADTIDGLASKESSKEKILNIMKDSRIGTMGVLAIIFTVLFKYISLNNINPQFINYALINMGVISRWSMALCINTSNCAKNEGLAKIFIEYKSLKSLIISSIIALGVLFLIFFPKSFAIIFEIAVFTIFLNWYIKSKIGGITGDTLGAINEINEILILLIFIIIC